MIIARPTRFTADELQTLESCGCSSTISGQNRDTAHLHTGCSVEVVDGPGKVLFFAYDDEGMRLNHHPAPSLEKALDYL